jgi:hypothetical protein|tara:strand:- start:224 stop:382 length:159 start_codon:yes stop_codon:yes gene_type:complete
MLDVCELIMVKEVINSLELIIEKKVRVGNCMFLLSVMVIPTHSFLGVKNGYR